MAWKGIDAHFALSKINQSLVAADSCHASKMFVNKWITQFYIFSSICMPSTSPTNFVQETCKIFSLPFSNLFQIY